MGPGVSPETATADAGAMPAMAGNRSQRRAAKKMKKKGFGGGGGFGR